MPLYEQLIVKYIQIYINKLCSKRLNLTPKQRKKGTSEGVREYKDSKTSINMPDSKVLGDHRDKYLAFRGQ